MAAFSIIPTRLMGNFARGEVQLTPGQVEALGLTEGASV